MPPAQRAIGAAILRIATNCLALGTARRVTVLLQVQTNQIKLVIGRNLNRQRGFGCSVRLADGNDFSRGIAQNGFARALQNNLNILNCFGNRKLDANGRLRRQVVAMHLNLLPF